MTGLEVGSFESATIVIAKITVSVNRLNELLNA